MKKPHAVPNAKRIAFRSYSLWLNRLAFLSMAGPAIFYKLFGFGPDPELLFWIGVALYLGVEIARYVRQDSLHSPAIVAMLALFFAMGQVPAPPPAPATEQSVEAPARGYTQAEFLDIAVPFIATWEGLRLEAYQDVVGVWTVCYGETKGVQPRDRYTKAECRDMLAREVVSYQQGWHGYLKPETLTQRLHAKRDTAFTSLAYNIGVAGAGKSTATRRLNAGNIAGACDGLTWFVKGGGRIIRGLKNRRAAEYPLCMAGV